MALATMLPLLLLPLLLTLHPSVRSLTATKNNASSSSASFSAFHGQPARALNMELLCGRSVAVCRLPALYKMCFFASSPMHPALAPLTVFCTRQPALGHWLAASATNASNVPFPHRVMATPAARRLPTSRAASHVDKSPPRPTSHVATEALVPRQWLPEVAHQVGKIGVRLRMLDSRVPIGRHQVFPVTAANPNLAYPTPALRIPSLQENLGSSQMIGRTTSTSALPFASGPPCAPLPKGCLARPANGTRCGNYPPALCPALPCPASTLDRRTLASPCPPAAAKNGMRKYFQKHATIY
ncbi:uncharacterized protein SETTUDRAFT_37313 [Exserohilum turcica Et28A]|uniref:Uncharacterized protein n=1 Tax=Exserohilum turcicum (strain 28A) TaxID=671987 RepID=R0IYP6_EXST2|nr:uncharacterized protein SETTUDRAFT_37313 [Exserohilum turcica Et28A]EOA89646.1 hypothetical protein SETTUDRAFT_37313 [Exserohilum turcica Et28A]